jgi:MFS-type transporter involved in bile tolerance (Atg22 family)
MFWAEPESLIASSKGAFGEVLVPDEVERVFFSQPILKAISNRTNAFILNEDVQKVFTVVWWFIFISPILIAVTQVADDVTVDGVRRIMTTSRSDG